MSLDFNGAYSVYNLINRIKDVACVTNLEEYEKLGIHWITIKVKNDKVTYFVSSGDAHIPKKPENLLVVKISMQIFTECNRLTQYVWILLHWIYWFLVKKKRRNKFY